MWQEMNVIVIIIYEETKFKVERLEWENIIHFICWSGSISMRNNDIFKNVFILGLHVQ